MGDVLELYAGEINEMFYSSDVDGLDSLIRVPYEALNDYLNLPSELAKAVSEIWNDFVNQWFAE